MGCEGCEGCVCVKFILSYLGFNLTFNKIYRLYVTVGSFKGRGNQYILFHQNNIWHCNLPGIGQ